MTLVFVTIGVKCTLGISSLGALSLFTSSPSACLHVARSRVALADISLPNIFFVIEIIIRLSAFEALVTSKLCNNEASTLLACVTGTKQFRRRLSAEGAKPESNNR